MTSISDPQTPAASRVQPLRAKWGWVLALGIIYLVAGVIALYSIITATIVSVFVVGIMMLIAGVGEVFNAFS